MNELVTLSVEQLEMLKASIKQDIISDIKLGNAKRWKKELVGVERKYHHQLVSINGGSTWNAIQRITAYKLGCKYVREIPDERVQEAAEIAEKMCIEVVKAFEKKLKRGEQCKEI